VAGSCIHISINTIYCQWNSHSTNILTVIYIIVDITKTPGGKLKWKVGNWHIKNSSLECDEFEDRFGGS